MVGAIGFEPMARITSRYCSTAELYSVSGALRENRTPESALQGRRVTTSTIRANVGDSPPTGS